MQTACFVYEYELVLLRDDELELSNFIVFLKELDHLVKVVCT